MSDRVIAFFVFMGIVLAAGGVGGIEHSTTDYDLLCSLAVSVLGLGLMWVATLMIRQQGYR